MLQQVLDDLRSVVASRGSRVQQSLSGELGGDVERVVGISAEKAVAGPRANLLHHPL